VDHDRDDDVDDDDIDEAEPRGAQTSMAARVRVTRVGTQGSGARGDLVVVEEPLRVHVTHRGAQHLLGSTMRTPGHDLELGAGLAVGEGVVRRRDDVVTVRPCRDGFGRQDDDVTVVVRDDVEVDLSKLGRVATPSSACGLCGRDEIDAIVAKAPPVQRDVRVDAQVLTALPDAMRERQSVFRRTGGLHAAALATADGRVLVVREDVGRHNAVDKVVGYAALNGLEADVLVVSGRAGFEIVQKAAMAGIPVVASVSAPTSLSVGVAAACGITLAAFVRDGHCNIYSGHGRIVETTQGTAVAGS
jgi:FdhD protein